MSFQNKIMFTYSIFILAILLTLGVCFYIYNANLFQKNAEGNLKELASKTSQQLDACVKEMDNMSVEIIADKDIIDALRSLSLDSASYSESDFVRFSDNIQKTVAISAIFKSSIYRASIFNKDGYFISSNTYDELSGRIKEKIRILPWIEKTRTEGGSKFLVVPHIDDWNSTNLVHVFSLARIINDPGKEIGIVEIQQNVKKLSQICDIKTTTVTKVVVIDNSNEIVYTNATLTKSYLEFYKQLAYIHGDLILHLTVPGSDTSEIISRHLSEYTGWTVLISQNKKDLLYPLQLTRNIIFLSGIAIILITLLFLYIFARYLTLPIKKLKETMETTNIENLPELVTVKSENNEIQALNLSYQKMRERLKKAIDHEIHSRSMQLKAHFNALQAQINPHFIYNMLGVLANMGDESCNDEISETCCNLAKMLRYSTSSVYANTTLREEIEHAGIYLSLMKKRHEHNLEYCIEIDEDMMDLNLPKLIIQPIVENSINHGFNDFSGVMKIEIKGRLLDDCWQISIMDNGSGFKPEHQQTLKDDINCYIQNLVSGKDSHELSIGGMGLISTFARLFLLYGNTLRFEIKNNESGGACILLGGVRSAPNDKY